MSARTNRRGASVAAGGEKAWASGRVLTPEQRARKQEVDRRANRVLKKEVQERLSLLESRVLQLERMCPGITVDLLKDREPDAQSAVTDTTQHDDRHSSRASLGDWPHAQNTNGFHGMPPIWNDPPNIWPMSISSSERINNGSTSTTTSFEGIDPNDTTHAWANGNAHSASEEMSSFAFVRDYGSVAIPPTIIATPAVHEFSYSPKHDDLFTTARLKPNGREITSTLSKLVTFVRSIPANQICFDDQCNQDLLVTAIVKGWDYSLARFQQKCPLWTVLQLVDLSLFRFCNLVERLSVLRILHKMYLFEVGTRLNGVEGPLPAWYKPQPSQQLVSHEPVIDHLAWPKLRAHLILSENNVLTNRFWEQVVRNFRFAWNDHPLSSIHFEPSTSTYRLSPIFESAIHNVQNWRMDLPFLNYFPHLANDIQPAIYMPLTTIMPSFGLPERAMTDRKFLQQGFNNSSLDFMVPGNEEDDDVPTIQDVAWHQQPRGTHRHSVV
ncbi:Hypothetical protein R9X50_00372500 [Acrodontium crateriforme]|uniref:BZIP domain-containing protein n=1 Tax=Acrodontium crateriforme TaxID=150365 RepID=A0AAQ3R4G4_9PEZI|nr:Hypothetical protein R9X50_00372500 [Acrodontium crateriforme]